MHMNALSLRFKGTGGTSTAPKKNVTLRVVLWLCLGQGTGSFAFKQFLFSLDPESLSKKTKSMEVRVRFLPGKPSCSVL